MGILEEIKRALGVGQAPGGGRPRSSLPIPPLPNPGEVKEVIKEVVDSVRGLNDLPKDLIDSGLEANEDFQRADKMLRGARFKSKKKKRR